MANIITCIRIVCGIALLFCPVFSPVFYVLYIIAGVSDMIDGTVARKTDTVSEFGAKFDTIADFIFAAVCIIKLLPVFNIHLWIYIWIAIIAVIKILNIILGYIFNKEFTAVHSILNKITGCLLFLLPLTITFIDTKYSVIVVCAAATIAAVYEGYLVLSKKSKVI
jgi:CDP-diacylglycerol--glycerol-3-phosphate 3-phosphatidyltransferase